ncbi:hypothetical protein [Acinetobacter oleivorans]|uniref:hypothetical protein n=1 Tax=Acinetobacter oleivorans TaxID=1148157 RepID=UPI0017862787|nr:hypothetical protein [Acinetobacter oleivorans]
MKRYLLLTCIMASNSCMAYSDTPSLQTSCENISVQAVKVMERRQAGVTLSQEKEALRKFMGIRKYNSERVKSAFETVMNKILIDVYKENIKENDFENEMMTSRFRQKIFNKCLSGELIDESI